MNPPEVLSNLNDPFLKSGNIIFSLRPDHLTRHRKLQSFHPHSNIGSTLHLILVFLYKQFIDIKKKS